MSKKKKVKNENLRLNPENRVCSEFDEYSIKKYSLPSKKRMGVRVVDNCAEEHMM